VWTIRGPIADRDKILFGKLPDWLWGPLRFLWVSRTISAAVKWPGREPDLQPVPSLRISGVTLLLLPYAFMGCRGATLSLPRNISMNMNKNVMLIMTKIVYQRNNNNNMENTNIKVKHISRAK
jgi:hypothetical protein